MSTAGKSNRGFTLVELALVLLLIGLFAGLTVPLLTGVGEDSLGSSARRIAGTVKYYYNEAALKQTPFRLVYDIDNGTFRVKQLERDGELVDAEGVGRLQRLKGDVRFKDLDIAGRGKRSSGEVVTEILPIGWMEGTVIHLAEGSRNLTLRINPFTGQTEVFDGYREF
ncbi:hypothetical protein DESUT3_30530 [Desulfuromonas versatilis]|uniref:Prepilin-type N-terminal cleavage/methylation domain-containing protein n=1 Tax=Desulfuromonas versatilis TaxID=2802975 RepID=A0ABM8HZM9_9BACT|nr:prepilin-type N-terminal cleavage/methylation domain-containing protein [Desulfuromonas versatilis]BCR05984.1 hypothetical protein DESUT3_30530 [Desulfuromonas versatilis]